MFSVIPRSVRHILDEESVKVFSLQIYESNLGPALRIGAEYNWRRERISPLTPPESKRLKERVRTKLREEGYKCKIRVFKWNGTRYPNEFRIKILLHSEDISEEYYEKVVEDSHSHEKAKTVRESFGS